MIVCLLYIDITRKCPLRGHILAPPEELRAPELPGVNPGGWPRESGGDSKAIEAKKIFCDERTPHEGWTDRRDSRNSVVDVYEKCSTASVVQRV